MSVFNANDLILQADLSKNNLTATLEFVNSIKTRLAMNPFKLILSKTEVVIKDVTHEL